MPDSSVTKAIELMVALSEHPLTIKDIALFLHVEERSAYYYIDRINKAFPGKPLLIKKKNKWLLESSKGAGAIIDSGLDDRLALIATTSPFGSLIKSSMHLFSSEVFGRTKALASPIVDSGVDDSLGALFQALENKRTVKMHYRQIKEEEKEYTIIPIKLFLDPIETYLVAWDKNLERLLTFGISKIASIEAGDNTEQNTYIVDKCRMYIGSAWGKMIRNEAIGISTVSFDTDPYVSQYFASRQLHWKQITLKRPDGGLHIELPVHNPLEIVRFLLRFGKGVTIKGNEEVLSEMKRFLGEMIEFYDC